MLVVILINLVVVATLVFVASRRGVEQALPYFAFFAVLLPQEARIRLPGLFDLYSIRIGLMTLLVLFLVFPTKATIRRVPLKNLMYLHIAWVLGSTAFSIVFMTSIKQMLAQVVEYYLLYFLILKTVSDVRTITKITFAMVAAMGVCSIFGLLEIYAHWTVLSIFPAENQLTYGGSDALYAEMFDRGLRARATFPHPIHFGGALAMTIPFAFHLAVTSKGWKRSYLNVTLFLMFWALYKTSSRGPWLATVCGMVVLTLAGSPKARRRILTIAVLAGAVLLLRPGILDTLVNMYRATMDPTTMMGSSFEYRPVLLRTVTGTLNDNAERAILGFGLGSFREKGLILVLPGIETHRWYTCDSTWILFAYETGYIGLLILGTLLIRPAAMAWQSFRQATEAGSLLQRGGA